MHRACIGCKSCFSRESSPKQSYRASYKYRRDKRSILTPFLPHLIAPTHRRTPLHLACRWGRVGAIRELVAAGADVNKQTGDGRTPGELLKVEMDEGDRNEVVKLLGKSSYLLRWLCAFYGPFILIFFACVTWIPHGIESKVQCGVSSRI